MHKKICVLGDGSWGTAIASLLASNGYHVNLWCYNSEIAKSINNKNINKIYFPNVILDTKIKAFTNLQDAINGTQWVFEAIPIKFLRPILNQLKNFLNKDHILVVLSKGIEQETFFLPTQMIDDVFSNQVKKCVLSGPSFASELIEKKFTAVDIAASDNFLNNELSNILNNEYCRVELCEDIISMQVVGALKNIITLALGISDGYYNSNNTKAYILINGLKEVTFLLKFFNGDTSTLNRLSGIGDLVLSAYSNNSKNYKFGFHIGQGKTINDFLNTNLNLPEGVNSIQSINRLIIKNNLELPLIRNIYKIIFENAGPNTLLRI